MRRSGLFLAAAALLAAGCDYLDNLTDGKTIDRSDLTVTLVDAWTRAPLPGSWCSVPGVGSHSAGADGKAVWKDLPTGKYTLACTSGRYYPRYPKIELAASAGSALTVDLARRGDDWYQNEPSRQVSFQVAEGNYRYPGRLKLIATPADPSEIFSYEWSSNLPKDALVRRNDTLWARVDNLPGESGPVDIDVKVSVTLADTTYEVGTFFRQLFMNPNLPPVLEVGFRDSSNHLKVGCTEGGDYVEVALSATDPDGVCEHILLASTSASPSFEAFKDTLSCFQMSTVVLPVKPHYGLPDTPTTRRNTLIVKAVDDNGAFDTDTLRLTTFSNLHPWITIEQEGTLAKNFANTQLDFMTRSMDRDGRIEWLVVDWGDGMTDSLPSPNRRNPDVVLEKAFSHTYRSTGNFRVKVLVTDICHATDSVFLPITVVANKPPEVTVQSEGYSASTKEFRISLDVEDVDVGSGMDILKVEIDWGDGKPDTVIQADPYQNVRQMVGHAYDPASAAAFFSIEVTATDSYKNSVTDTLRITRTQATGTQ